MHCHVNGGGRTHLIMEYTCSGHSSKEKGQKTTLQEKCAVLDPINERMNYLPVILLGLFSASMICGSHQILIERYKLG